MCSHPTQPCCSVLQLLLGLCGQLRASPLSFNSFCLLLHSDFHAVQVPSLPLFVALMNVACG